MYGYYSEFSSATRGATLNVNGRNVVLTEGVPYGNPALFDICFNNICTSKSLNMLHFKLYD